MSKAQQSQLLSTPSEDAAYIETDGRLLRPATALLTPLVDELKLEVTEDGLHTRYIDPANVGLGDVSIYREAFHTYEVDADLTLGVNITGTASTIQKARMGRGNTDDVSLDLDERRTQVAIEREYQRHNVELTDELLNIDPDAIRQKPNRPDFEKYLSWSADIDVKALFDVVEHFDADHVLIAERDGHLVFCEQDDDGLHEGDYASVGDFGAVASEFNNQEPGAASLFSMDYLGDIVKALKRGKVTDLTIRWGEQAPVVLDFARSFEDTTLYDGEFVISPRFEEDSED